MRPFVNIDPHHNAAIRTEVGERLRIILGLSRPHRVPGSIRRPLDRLTEQGGRIEMKSSAVQSEHKGWLRRLLGGRRLPDSKKSA